MEEEGTSRTQGYPGKGVEWVLDLDATWRGPVVGTVFSPVAEHGGKRHEKASPHGPSWNIFSNGTCLMPFLPSMLV